MTKLKIFRFSFLKARCLNKRWDAIENMQPKRNQSDHNFCQFAVKQKNNELKSCFSIRLHAMQNCWMIKIKGTMFGETLWQLLQWEHSTPTTSVPRSIYYAPYSPTLQRAWLWTFFQVVSLTSLYQNTWRKFTNGVWRIF